MPVPPAPSGLAARIAAALPQTQCTRCGYSDCEAYAQAIATGTAEINQCPPGGHEGVERISRITGRPVLSLSAAHGAETPRSAAVIDESWCIGCTLCLAACPTDAIVGANKLMHTVIEAHCTGCGLCLPVCPVDCIALVNASENATGWQAWSSAQAGHAKERYELRTIRVVREQQLAAAPTQLPGRTDKQAAIEAALARSRKHRPT
ncbi:MAG: RnfABCDGE type electron transport complex subunit B [Giesbergeria sp.]